MAAKIYKIIYIRDICASFFTFLICLVIFMWLFTSYIKYGDGKSFFVNITLIFFVSISACMIVLILQNGRITCLSCRKMCEHVVLAISIYVCILAFYILYNKVYGSKFYIFCNKTRKSAIKTLIFLGKVLEIPEKVLPLHPLSRNNECSSKARVRVVEGSDKRKSSLKDLR